MEPAVSPRITIVAGDLTAAAVDAIVNAANQRMLGGGGVDGAIHHAAGPELAAACRRVHEVRPGVRCPTGEARITAGFGLPARFVIHTVGPVHGTPDDAALLAAAHRSCLELAVAEQLRTIAFPAISCGAFGYPPAQAAAIARQVTLERPWRLEEIRFVLFSDALLATWQRAFGA